MKYVWIVSSFLVCKAVTGQLQNSVTDSFVNARFIRFTPTSFSNLFSLNVTPVLTLHSGDTVDTETIDAFGYDKHSVKRQKGGNPLTGPFYIENALAGDVLKVTLTKVSLNRSYARTSESFVSRSMPDSIAKQFKKSRIIRWTLDREKGLAYPDSPYTSDGNLSNFKVPLHPFLGCIGVAPNAKRNEILSFFQGDFGGNLDFTGIRQSATVYLPVLHDGGYLYIGDGHAVQGDGEIADPEIVVAAKIKKELLKGLKASN